MTLRLMLGAVTVIVRARGAAAGALTSLAALSSYISGRGSLGLSKYWDRHPLGAVFTALGFGSSAGL